MTLKKQNMITDSLTKNERIELCHFLLCDLREIFPSSCKSVRSLPIWGPVPEKYRRNRQDSWHIWGLEAQSPAYVHQALVNILKESKRSEKNNGDSES